VRICERTPGVFPYEFVDSFEKFEATHLPAQCDFYSSLSEESVSDSDYAFAQTIWSEFDMRTFQDYHNLYLLLDVLQLADVFTSYRETCYTHYKLDPANFFTSPALSWHAMLLKTGASIELISDPDTHQFIEQNVRGGVAVASKRHVEANIPGTEEHNPDEPDVALAYLDANNLYGFRYHLHIRFEIFIYIVKRVKINSFNFNKFLKKLSFYLYGFRYHLHIRFEIFIYIVKRVKINIIKFIQFQ
jgi:hypothetical protein